MEDFIFDDDVDDVGAEVEAHCPKCRADTTHVVISKYEDEIRRVQCNPCGDVHAYRKPKGEAGDEEATPETPKKKVKARPTWDQIMAKSKKQPRPYAINEYYKENEILTHPKFGNGFVSENIGEDKIEVTFQTDKRVLIHNRKNLTLPFLRPLAPPSPKNKKIGAKGAARPAGKKPVAAAKPAKPASARKQATAAKKPVAAKKSAAKPAKAKGSARPAAKKPAKSNSAAAKAKPKKAAKKGR
jgi:hypothetical protein